MGLFVALLVGRGDENFDLAVTIDIDEWIGGCRTYLHFRLVLVFCFAEDLLPLADRGGAVLSDCLYARYHRIDHQQRRQVTPRQRDRRGGGPVGADLRSPAGLHCPFTGCQVVDPQLLVRDHHHVGPPIAVHVGKQMQRRVDGPFLVGVKATVGGGKTVFEAPQVAHPAGVAAAEFLL